MRDRVAVAAALGLAAVGVAVFAWRRRQALKQFVWASQHGAEKATVAGGHEDSIMLEGDRLLKKQQNQGRGAREVEFLKKAANHPFLKDWAPVLYGVREINGEAWTEMSNLTAGMDMPVVLDLKLGTQTWTPGCSEEKRKYHEAKAKASTSLKLGVRVTGGTIRNGFGEELESIGYKKKKEVRSEAELRDCLGRYLCSDVMRREFLEKMRALHAWFSTQSDFHFFGTSVLLAFDGSVECPSELRVGLIDFPHVQEVNTPDESCKAGAATLLRVAADIVQASSK